MGPIREPSQQEAEILSLAARRKKAVWGIRLVGALKGRKEALQSTHWCGGKLEPGGMAGQSRSDPKILGKGPGWRAQSSVLCQLWSPQADHRAGGRKKPVGGCGCSLRTVRKLMFLCDSLRLG